MSSGNVKCFSVWYSTESHQQHLAAGGVLDKAYHLLIASGAKNVKFEFEESSWSALIILMIEVRGLPL